MDLTEVQKKRLLALVLKYYELLDPPATWYHFSSVIRIVRRRDNVFGFSEDRFQSPFDPTDLPPLQNLVDYLHKHEFLDVPAVQPYHLQHLYVDDLKELLREAGLKLSGHKAMLIDRLIEEAPAIADREGKHKGRLVTTPKGQAFLADYFDFAEHEKNAYLSRINLLLANTVLKGARAVVNNYASRQIAGIGGKFIDEFNALIDRS